MSDGFTFKGSYSDMEIFTHLLTGAIKICFRRGNKSSLQV